MNIVARTRFGEVETYQLGFGPVGPPLMSVHMYRVDGILIDSGQRHMQAAVVELLAAERIERILLTHHHEDHSGNVAAVAGIHGAAVIGHPETGALMRSGSRLRPYQHYVWGKAEPVEVAAFGRAIETSRLKLLPIHTPGHSVDHTVYLEENNGWLFSGDLYLGDKIKYFRADEQLAVQIDSLRKVLRFDFEAVFCGHRPCLHDGKSRLEDKLSFLEDFRGSVLQLAAKGYSERVIIRKLSTGQDRLVKWVTLGNVSFANMVRSALNCASV